jgi:cytochrome b6-f complex iron-sulfur subunit
VATHIAAPHHAVGGPTSISRRWFLRIAVLGSLGAIFAQATGCFVHFYYPTRVGTFGGKILAGKPEDIKEGEVKYIRDGKFYMSRVPEGLLALYQKCPHLGCAVPYNGPADSDRAFACPCHGSLYDYNGSWTGGPAPRSMDYMAVTVHDDGSVTVDTGDIRERAEYEPAQAAPYTV